MWDKPIKELAPGKWWIDVSNGRDQSKRIRTVFRGTEEGALALHSEIKRQLGKLIPSKVTIGALAEQYLDYVRIHQSPKTFRDKKRMLFSNLLPYLGGMRPELIVRSTIEAYKQRRLARSEKIHRTINVELLCLSAMVKWAAEQGIVPDPLPHYPKLPYKRPIPDVLTKEETLALLSSASPKFRGFLLCLYHAGMRFNEVAKLQWHQVNFQADIIRVRGKGDKERLVPMTDELRKTLEGLPRKALFVFPSKRMGKTLTDIRKPLKSAPMKAGITKNVTPHKLRHSFATTLIRG